MDVYVDVCVDEADLMLNFHQPAVAATEGAVAWLWASQRYLARPLVSDAGQSLTVVYPGRPRGVRGPDFQEAILATERGALLKGDVEVHLRSSNWNSHGHHRDPFYRQTLLHVVLWKDTARPCLTTEGRSVPVIPLADHLTVGLKEALSRAPAWSGLTKLDLAPPCGDSSPDLPWILERAGLQRLASKEARFQGDLTLHEPQQALFTGIMEALGYRANVAPFRALAESLPCSALARLAVRSSPEAGALSLEALLLGTAGLLPSQRGVGPADPYSQRLETLWQGLRHYAPGSLEPGAWELAGVRPANGPQRRLAGLARLLSTKWRRGLLPLLEEALFRDAPREAARELVNSVTVRDEGYWALHRDLGVPLSRPNSGLVGSARARDMVANVVLPFFAALGEHEDRPQLRERALDSYAELPKGADNEVLRHMSRQIFGRVPAPQVNSACRQQGLLHLYRLWCKDRDCAACPVAASLAEKGASRFLAEGDLTAV